MRKIIVLLIALVALSFAGLQSTSAQIGATWSGSFYNNPYLIDPGVVNVTVNSIAFNWGTGSPTTGVNADYFSARFGADVTLPAGTYRFFALADDAVAVTIDYNQRIINTFEVALSGQVLVADITLSAGVHHIQVDYRENGDNAFLYLNFFDLATNPTGPGFPASAPVTSVGGTTISTSGAINTSTWTTQYFANTTLSGFPTVIQTEVSPNRNWGFNAPFASMPADNFTVRWSSVQSLGAGNYIVNVRADDGVRVTVDGVVYINQFPGNVGQVYSVTIPLTAGQHTFVVEYLELAGAAYIEYALTLQGAPVVTVPTLVPTVPPVVTGATVTINVFELNVRSQPSTRGTVLVRVHRGEIYPIVGRNADSTWYQINVNGTVGWVAAGFIVPSANATLVPITDSASSSGSIQLTGYTLTGNTEVNIRSGPSARYNIVGRLPQGATANIVGRTRSNSWWQISYNGIVGWVSGRFVTTQNGIDLNRVPING